MAHTPPGETRKQVYQFVRQRLLLGHPPTIREVQAAFGFRAVESARSHLNALVEEGLLVKRPGRARGYALPGTAREGARSPGPPPLLVPLLSQVQAGELQLAVEHPAGYIAVQPGRHPPEALFALTVQGRSMTGAGILPGDVVIVRQQPIAEDDEIVVALVGEEATVKRLRRRRGRLELHPANPRFKPIVPDSRQLQILGRVIEVRRRLA